MVAAPQLLEPVDYRPIDEINSDLCDIRDRLSAVESVVYKPARPEAVPTRQERLDSAQAAIREAADIYIDLGVIDEDVLTRIAHMLIVERVVLATREGRI